MTAPTPCHRLTDPVTSQQPPGHSPCRSTSPALSFEEDATHMRHMRSIVQDVSPLAHPPPSLSRPHSHCISLCIKTKTLSSSGQVTLLMRILHFVRGALHTHTHTHTHKTTHSRLTSTTSNATCLPLQCFTPLLRPPARRTPPTCSATAPHCRAHAQASERGRSRRRRLRSFGR